MPLHKRRVKRLAVPLSFITFKPIRSRTHIPPSAPFGLPANDPNSLQDFDGVLFPFNAIFTCHYFISLCPFCQEIHNKRQRISLPKQGKYDIV